MEYDELSARLENLCVLAGMNDERNSGTEGRSEQDVPQIPPMHGILNERERSERTERFERFERSNRR